MPIIPIKKKLTLGGLAKKREDNLYTGGKSVKLPNAFFAQQEHTKNLQKQAIDTFDKNGNPIITDKNYNPNNDWSMKGVGGTAIGVGQIALGLGSYFEQKKTAELQRNILRQQGEANNYAINKARRNDIGIRNAFKIRK